MELYDIETDCEPWRAGIVTMAPVPDDDSPEAMVEWSAPTPTTCWPTAAPSSAWAANTRCRIGLIQAHAARYPGLTVLQFDAHGDTRDQYEGSPNNHACVMARAAEVCRLCAGRHPQPGRRREAPKLVPGRTFFAHEIGDMDATVPAVVERIAGPVYITIDLDVLDPSEMPSTGTPEPGGLSYRQLVESARGGVQPAAGRRLRRGRTDAATAQNLAPDFLAARLAYQLMAFVCIRPSAFGKGESR